MANCITRSIPNTLTCLNLFSGCIACIMAFEANYNLALLFIILSAVFDFFDGMMARLLDAHSPIGKDLDSLADDVSFGVAPSLVVFSLFKEMHYPASMEFMAAYMPYASFLISVFSALRLAKFNNDPPDKLFHWSSGSCQCSFLGIIGCRDAPYAYIRQFQSSLPVNVGLPVFMAAGVGNTHVLIEVQESLMERQQNKFHFPDCLHPTSCFFKGQRLCSGDRMVHRAFTFNGKK